MQLQEPLCTVSAKAKKDQQEAEAAEAAKARPDPVKFGVKAKEQSTSNVQPTNVLETAGRLLYY